MFKPFLPLSLIVVVLGGLGIYLINHQKVNLPVPIKQGNVCEPDSMVCSDGSVVYRSGPNCDFPPCPASASPSGTTFGEKITVSGTLICLPHKNTNGPQTLECAFGLKGDDGNNYGLTDPNWKYLIGVGNGTRIAITGKLNKKPDQKYDSVGIIEIETLEKL